MEDSSSSKVTVEYHDPSGVFPLIARELANRLPLRNLNWQSTGRPLRQIKHLHVEFIPDAETDAILHPKPLNRTEVERLNSIEILRSGADAQKSQGKERRHQIPGLKTTPYLKLYILRCDDKNWYKQEERQKLKAWVREAVPVNGKQEQHDTFNWLIVHVVIPDTIAASEPRWRESAKDPDELKERSKGSNAKWPGKPPKTVFDRLRSDFNDGKLEGNHIAQIRLSKTQVSVDLLPVPALARTLEETGEEREKSWSDLMTKIRTSILTSFDARVRQYEADTTEQEARQSMPGWNFCTFFIHKEGLARALESVGLLEDALTIYDELALGLETIIVDLTAGRAPQTATTFPPTGTEVVNRILGATNQRNGVHDRSSLPRRARRIFDKDFRQEIVRSSISIFDFFCYLFDRQTALILRLAGRSSSSSSRSESGVRESGDDLVMLAEICWRGLSFIHNGARMLKQDLAESIQDLSADDANSLVTSWTFSAADYVLERTHSTHLDLTDAGIKEPGKLANGNLTSPRKDFDFSMGADAHPARTSSLPAKKTAPRTADVKSDSSTQSAGRISEDGVFIPPNSSAEDEIRPEVPGLAELGAYRAELVILKRKMLEELANSKGWRAGWASLSLVAARPGSMGDFISSAKATAEPVGAQSTMIGADAAKLVATREDFNNAFEDLTETAIRHYLSATHSKSAEKLMGDLAILKFSEQDYASAEAFFEHASPLYQRSGWGYLEAVIIMLRTECLERLGKHKDAITCAATLVSQIARRRMQDQHNITSDHENDTLGTVAQAWNLDTLASRSANLAEAIELPLLDFFFDLNLDHSISHPTDRDGFTYRIGCANVFDKSLELDRVSLNLTSAVDSSQTVTLCSTQPVSLTPGMSSIELRSNTSTLGQYMLTSVVIQVQKLIFVHDFAPKQPVSPLVLTQATEDTGKLQEARPSLVLFPSIDALDAQISLANPTALHRSRYIAITINSGWNEITSLDVKLKPTSAGLRLHTTELILDGLELRQDSSFRTGLIQLGPMPRYTKAVINVRISFEQAKSELAVKAQIEYRTKDDDFSFLTDVRLPAQLPIDVDVNDVFKPDLLFSSFSVRSTDGVAMLVTEVELHGTEAYEVLPPPIQTLPALVLPNHFVDFPFMIRRSGNSSTELTKTDATLELALSCFSALDAIKQSLTTAFDTELQHTTFKAYRRLLIPVMIKRFQHAFSPDDLSAAMLLHEAKTPSFADFGWFEIIDTLPIVDQRPLSDWLMKWHIEHQRIRIDIDILTILTNKQLVIAVEAPELHFLFTVTVSNARSATLDDVIEIGKPLSLRFSISASTMWSRSKPAIDEPRTFTYELAVAEDIWMLGGYRRARFSIGPDAHEHTIELVLVPLKPGLHPLPTLSVQPVADEARQTVSCETNLAYAGLVLQVLHHRQRTTHVVFEKENN